MKKTILFIVTNGSGLGHLTRGLAVAKRLREIDSQYEIVFLTTSLATEVIRENNFMFYYVPTIKLMPEGINSGVWNSFLRKQIEDIVALYNPVGIVFDGAVPYAGMLGAIKNKSLFKSVWIKRECYKKQVDNLAEKEEYFDLIIVPDEVSDTKPLNQNQHKVYTKPIMLLDKNEVYTREFVREELNIKEEEKLFYVQLGAGNINSIDAMVQRIVNEIIKNPNYHVLLGEYIIGKHFNIKHPRVKTIRSFPNAQYFNGVDIAVSAAGYNTLHELVFFGVPTLFIPNTATGRDDQIARVKKVENAQAGMMLNSLSSDDIQTKIHYLVRNQETFSNSAKSLITENGAWEAARYIKALMK